MTYCVGVKLKKGLVFMSDTLTNAGVDNLSHHKKMFHWEVSGERVLVLLTSGNLATTQSVINKISECTKQKTGNNNILKTSSMFRSATIVGNLLRDAIKINETKLQQLSNNPYSATVILGGQIKGEEPKMFLVYPEGNFIEASEDEPFLQVGETKYGKPILVRALEYGMDFQQVV